MAEKMFFNVTTLYRFQNTSWVELAWWPEHARSSKEAQKILACASAELVVKKAKYSSLSVTSSGLNITVKSEDIPEVVNILFKFYQEVVEKKRNIKKCRKNYKKLSIPKEAEVFTVGVDISITPNREIDIEHVPVEVMVYMKPGEDPTSKRVRRIHDALEAFASVSYSFLLSMFSDGTRYEILLPATEVPAIAYHATVVAKAAEVV